MGLFDTFIPPETLTCPACNKDHIVDLQTKDLDPAMTVYRIGDKVDIGISTLSVILNGKVSCYEWCNESHTLPHYWAIIEDSIYTGLEYFGTKVWNEEKREWYWKDGPLAAPLEGMIPVPDGMTIEEVHTAIRKGMGLEEETNAIGETEKPSP